MEMEIIELLIYLGLMFLMGLWLHVAIFLLTGDNETELDYLIRLFVVAFVAVIIAPLLAWGFLLAGVTEIAPIAMFVILVYTVKMVLIPALTVVEEWEKSIWITFLALLFFYGFMALIRYTLSQDFSLYPTI